MTHPEVVGQTYHCISRYLLKISICPCDPFQNLVSKESVIPVYLLRKKSSSYYCIKAWKWSNLLGLSITKSKKFLESQLPTAACWTVSEF